jgi:hypothetical protein
MVIVVVFATRTEKVPTQPTSCSILYPLTPSLVALTGAIQLRFICEPEDAWAVRLVGGCGAAVCAKTCSNGAASVLTSRIKMIPVVFIE